MESLFAVELTLPNGFKYIPDFLSPLEEKQLYDYIATVPLHTFHFQGYEARRNVASFGYDYNFENRSLTKGQELPLELGWLIRKVNERLGTDIVFAEALLTEYPVGSVINWHRDAPPFDIIAGISLLADCTFRLRPQRAEQRTRKSVISVPVQRRSLYVIRENRVRTGNTVPVR